MRRLLLQATAIVMAGTSGLFAWAWSEARLAFITLGASTALGLWSLARRFPPPSERHFLVAAAGTLVAAVAVAVLLPSTQILCDCPVPQQAVRAFACPCAVDDHIPLRVGAMAAGAVIAGLFVLRTRSRSRVRSPAWTSRL